MKIYLLSVILSIYGSVFSSPPTGNAWQIYMKTVTPGWIPGLSSFREISIFFLSFPGRRLYQCFGARLCFGTWRLYRFWGKIWRVSGFRVVQTVSVFCRISAFCYFCHLWFSAFTSMHRVRDPRVFRDDSWAVLDFLKFCFGFCRVLSFFNTFCHFGDRDSRYLPPCTG